MITSDQLIPLLKTGLLLLILLFLCFPAIHAQELNLGVNGQLAVPQNEFDESINTLGGGININGLYRFADVPFGLGLDFNFINFGRDTRDEPLSTTIPDLRVEVENRYNLLQLLAQAKVQSRDGIFRPFIEGLVGFNYFFTETSINERGFGSSDPIASDTNFEDFAFAWGGGAGLMIRVFDHRGRESINRMSEQIGAGYINLGIRFLNGSEAEYLREGSVQVENGDVTFDTLQSRTDMLMIQLGFVFRF